MIISRIISIILRLLQLASAAIVAGIVGQYLHDADEANVNPADRFIYTLVVASFSLLAALILLIPFTASLTLFPLDFLFFILWIASFGLLVGMYFTFITTLILTGFTNELCSNRLHCSHGMQLELGLVERPLVH